MAAALGEMRGSYSRVILDAPAMQPFSDAAVLAVQADATVLVVRFRRVTRELLGASLRNLELVKGTVAGAVLNALPRRLSESRRQPRKMLLLKQGHRAKVAPPEVPAETPPVKRAASRR